MKEIEHKSQVIETQPEELKPAWERMTKSTIYMGPGEAPELVDPFDMYKPAFMTIEERIEEDDLKIGKSEKSF